MNTPTDKTSREGIERAGADWRRTVKKATGQDIGQEAARRRVEQAVERGNRNRANGNR